MPSTRSNRRISDGQLWEAIKNTALHLSRHRKAEALLNLLKLDEMVPSTKEQMETDWRHASTHVATNVMTGRLPLSDLDPECFPRLESVWLDDIRQNLAYFSWINNREEAGFWSPDGVRQQYYHEACIEIRNLLVERRVKDRLENFVSVREYISERYLDEFQRFNGEHSSSLTELKVRRLSANAARQMAEVLAAEYSRKFYENIVPAVEACDQEACIGVLQAFQHGGSLPGFPSIVTCFEASVAISFLDATTVQALWKTAPNVSKDTTF
jgi:hypothetical protein